VDGAEGRDAEMQQQESELEDEDDEGGAGGEEGEEEYTFSWPPAMPVSVCLGAISGLSSDILRIFDFLESSAVINYAANVEQDVGGVWTERDLSCLCEAFLEHGANWPAVAAQLGRADAPEQCAVVLAAMVLRKSPLQHLSCLHAERLQRAMAPLLGQGVPSDSDSTQQSRAKAAAILGQASVVHRGIGLQAAAAAVDAVMQHCLAEKDKARAADDKGEKGENTDTHVMSQGEMHQLQEKACKASILAKLSLRSSLLAHREVLDMRRLMVGCASVVSLMSGCTSLLARV